MSRELPASIDLGILQADVGERRHRVDWSRRRSPSNFPIPNREWACFGIRIGGPLCALSGK